MDYIGSSIQGISQARILNGLPFPSPGDSLYHDPGVELTSPTLAGRFFTTKPSGKPWFCYSLHNKDVETEAQRGSQLA